MYVIYNNLIFWFLSLARQTKQKLDLYSDKSIEYLKEIVFLGMVVGENTHTDCFKKYI